MTQKQEDIEKLLKTYFAAGVTPEFKTNPIDAYVLKGRLELYCLCMFFYFKILQYNILVAGTHKCYFRILSGYRDTQTLFAIFEILIYNDPPSANKD